MSIPTTLHAARMQLRAPQFDTAVPSFTALYRDHPLAGIAPRVDVYLPEAEGPRPSVFLVHGGGFVLGHRRMTSVVWVATRLVRLGWAVAAIDYRLVFRGGRVREGVQDVRDGMRWWRSQAESLELDLDRVSMLGMSAGAALMYLAAGQVGPLHRVLSVYGLADFTNLRWKETGIPPRMLLGTTDEDALRACSPHAVFDSPAPLGLFHGTRDGLVDVADAHAMAAARRARGLPVQEYLYEDQPHGFFQYDPEGPVCTLVWADMLAFLRDGCGPGTEPVVRTVEQMAALP